MDATTITCPTCQTSFALTDAIERTILDRFRTQLAQESQDRDKVLHLREQELEAQAQKLKSAESALQQKLDQRLQEETRKIITQQEQKAKESVGLQLQELQQQLAEKARKLTEAQQQQLELMKQKRALDEQRQAFELDKARQIEAERDKIRQEATKVAVDKAASDLRDLQEKLATKDKLLSDAQAAELKLRHERNEFEEQKKAFELEVARRADEVRSIVAKEKDDEFRLREAESTKKLEEMKRQIDELRRKAEQGSQQTQGEVLELDLENALQRCFDGDEIVPVPKGAHGGDLLHHVHDEMGRTCGTIIWESKRTKAWSDGWLDKLKDDQRRAKAQLAIIVSTVLPKDVPHFECRQNVWVAPPVLAVPLAAALRLSLIEASTARRAIEGRQDKMSVVYDYLAGPEFKARITAIVEAFSAMRADLEREKRAMQKLWSAREKQIDRVVLNTAGMHGDLQGIIGHTLPAIDMLELSALPQEGADSDGPQ